MDLLIAYFIIWYCLVMIHFLCNVLPFKKWGHNGFQFYNTSQFIWPTYWKSQINITNYQVCFLLWSPLMIVHKHRIIDTLPSNSTFFQVNVAKSSARPKWCCCLEAITLLTRLSAKLSVHPPHDHFHLSASPWILLFFLTSFSPNACLLAIL
jgi:hypothetical protein